MLCWTLLRGQGGRSYFEEYGGLEEIGNLHSHLQVGVSFVVQQRFVQVCLAVVFGGVRCLCFKYMSSTFIVISHNIVRLHIIHIILICRENSQGKETQILLYFVYLGFVGWVVGNCVGRYCITVRCCVCVCMYCI